MMSDIERVLQSEYRNPDATKHLVQGYVPIGDQDEFVPAPERASYESFQPGVEPMVDPAAVEPVPVKRRGPGRPRKNK